MQSALAGALGVVLLAVAAKTAAQVPSLAAVPFYVPSPQRERLADRRALLDEQGRALSFRVDVHNKQCNHVPANSPASADCRLRMGSLQHDIAGYVVAVKEFNRIIGQLAAPSPPDPAGLMSEREEAEVGKSATAELDSRMTFVTDPRVTRYVESVFARLVAHAPRSRASYRIRVCHDCAAGLCWAACSLPGGSVYVSTRLIRLLENESELAGVLAHEVGHISARHFAQSRDDLARSTITAVLTGGPAWPVVQRALSFKNSRDHELEADRIAVEMLYQAGIRPTALTTTFEKFRRLSPPPSADFRRTIEEMYFSTHPSPQDRIESISPLFADPRFNVIRGVDSPEFRAIQKRLPL